MAGFIEGWRLTSRCVVVLSRMIVNSTVQARDSSSSAFGFSASMVSDDNTAPGCLNAEEGAAGEPRVPAVVARRLPRRAPGGAVLSAACVREQCTPSCTAASLLAAVQVTRARAGRHELISDPAVRRSNCLTV